MWIVYWPQMSFDLYYYPFLKHLFRDSFFRKDFAKMPSKKVHQKGVTKKQESVPKKKNAIIVWGNPNDKFL